MGDESVSLSELSPGVLVSSLLGRVSEVFFRESAESWCVGILALFCYSNSQGVEHIDFAIPVDCPIESVVFFNEDDKNGKQSWSCAFNDGLWDILLENSSETLLFSSSPKEIAYEIIAGGQ